MHATLVHQTDLCSAPVPSAERGREEGHTGAPRREPYARASGMQQRGWVRRRGGL